MANEVTVIASLTVLKTNDEGKSLVDHQTRPQQFTADMTGAKGPVPGSITTSTDGVDVDLSQLDRPKYCRVMNQDDDYTFDVGIKEPTTGLFYPLIEVGPRETYVIRLSRNLFGELGGTGTGTVGPATNTLHIRSQSGSPIALVEAFEE